MEMLKAGLATIYEAKTGAEFGGKEQIYRDAEALAKKRKKGIWGLAAFESPREYKTRMGIEEKGAAGHPNEKSRPWWKFW